MAAGCRGFLFVFQFLVCLWYLVNARFSLSLDAINITSTIIGSEHWPWSRGVVNSFGSYQAYYETNLLTTSTPSAISWIGSIQAFLLLIVGALSGPIYDAVSSPIHNFLQTISWPCRNIGILQAASICRFDIVGDEQLTSYQDSGSSSSTSTSSGSSGSTKTQKICNSKPSYLWRIGYG